MAESARARLGAARRGRIKERRKDELFSNIISTVGTIAAFAGGQIDKSKTAWGEYEAGYEALGGDVADIKKPGFFKRTAQQLLPGGETGLPQGDVTIGKKIYDREKITKAGSYLSSDEAALISKDQRTKYLEKVTPGRWDPSQFTKPAQGPHIYSDVEIEKMTPPKGTTFTNQKTLGLGRTGRIGTNIGFGEGTGGVTGPDFLQDYKAPSMYGNERTEAAPKGMYKGWMRSQEPVQTTGSKGWGKSFAHGGDFITNGPEEILVGDNPGGRERVTVRPLDSEDTKGYYGKAYNWLEALYANNERRKKY